MSKNNERGHHVCPWYMAYLFDNPLRRLVHDPVRILGPYVKPGMNVLDIGCGMGYFSLGMAALVGPQGRVLSLDLQAKMIQILMKRARRRGLSDRIDARLVKTGPLPVDRLADFALCFWMVHEVPDQTLFFRHLSDALEPGGNILIAEPGMHHVTREDLERTITIAAKEGLVPTDRPKVRMSHAVVLKKSV